jgi:hypothetical protein
VTTVDLYKPTHGGDGRFVGSEAAQKRRQEAVKLRLTGMSFTRIAEALGYADAATAYNAVKMELALTKREDADELREIESQRLDSLQEVMVAVLRSEHVVVSVQRGQVVIDQRTFEAVKDHGPVMNAVDRLLRISESRRKLLGIDAPPQVQRVDVTVTEVSQADVEWREMVNEERARRAAARSSATVGDED